jgi:hypothetical protein
VVRVPYESSFRNGAESKVHILVKREEITQLQQRNEMLEGEVSRKEKAMGVMIR